MLLIVRGGCFEKIFSYIFSLLFLVTSLVDSDTVGNNVASLHWVVSRTVHFVHFMKQHAFFVANIIEKEQHFAKAKYVCVKIFNLLDGQWRPFYRVLATYICPLCILI